MQKLKTDQCTDVRRRRLPEPTDGRSGRVCTSHSPFPSFHVCNRSRSVQIGRTHIATRAHCTYTGRRPPVPKGRRKSVVLGAFL